MATVDARLSWLSQSEAEFQAVVVQAAKLCGWLAYHTHDSRHSAAGFPDLVLVHPTRAGSVLFVELKREHGVLTHEQIAWLDALELAGAWVNVWRPSMWPTIEATLKGED